MKKFFCLILVFVVSFSAFSQKMMPKNIVFMIGDGMGFEQVRAAGMYLNGQEGTLAFESFPVKGEVTTRSADGTVTDSAATATGKNSEVSEMEIYGPDKK